MCRPAMHVHLRVQLPLPWTSANAMERSWGTARSPEGSEPEPPATGSSPQPMSLEPPRETQCALHVRAPRGGSEDFSCQLCTVGSAMPLSVFYFWLCSMAHGSSSLTRHRTCSPLQWKLGVLITGPHQGGPCPVF